MMPKEVSNSTTHPPTYPWMYTPTYPLSSSSSSSSFSWGSVWRAAAPGSGWER